MAKIQKITPFLWFDNQAEEAMNFYVSIFKNAKIQGVSRYGEGGPMPAGTVMTASFLLEGQSFTALNGGPVYPFTNAISFVIHCKNQQEIDHYWEKLSADGGSEIDCGWLKDKFGLAWQVIPTILPKLLTDPDRVKAQRAMTALWKMKKIVIKDLKGAPKKDSKKG